MATTIRYPLHELIAVLRRGTSEQGRTDFGVALVAVVINLRSECRFL